MAVNYRYIFQSIRLNANEKTNNILKKVRNELKRHYVDFKNDLKLPSCGAQNCRGRDFSHGIHRNTAFMHENVQL